MDPSVRIWDPFVRLFHWSLVVLFAVAWLTAEEWDTVHEWVGYGACGLVVLRLLWGLAGSRYARFSQFVRCPSQTRAYLGDIVRGRERRYLGHNPAGAVMVLLLLAGMIGLGATGWMATQRIGFAEDLHELIANGMLVLVGLHVVGVLLASLRHGENLMRAMVNGHKRPAEGNDIA